MTVWVVHAKKKTALKCFVTEENSNVSSFLSFFFSFFSLAASDCRMLLHICV